MVVSTEAVVSVASKTSMRTLNGTSDVRSAARESLVLSAAGRDITYATKQVHDMNSL